MLLSTLFAQAIRAAATFVLPAGVIEQNAAPSAAQFALAPVAAADRNPFSPTNASVAISGAPGDFDHVTAEFAVPMVRPVAQDRGAYAGFYIGLDVFDCPNMLIAGVQAYVTSRSAFYSVFWQWGSSESPREGVAISIVPTDEMKITVQATSRTTAVLTFSKNSGDQSQRLIVTLPDKPLCLSTPGWGASSLDGQLANFGDVAFDLATAGNGTAQAGPEDSRAFVTNIRVNGKTYTEIGRGAQSVTVRYTQ